MIRTIWPLPPRPCQVLPLIAIVGLSAFCWIASPSVADQPWPQFRGPAGDGISADQNPPVVLDPQQNQTWKVDLPGRAWSSPIIADGRVWLTTAIERQPTEDERIELLRKTKNDEKKFNQLAIAQTIELKLLCVDFESGKRLQTIDLVTIDQPDAIHSLNSYASPTPAADESFLYCHFGTFGTFCVERQSGSIVWRRVLPLEHAVGPGSSPFLVGRRLILIQDGMDRQYVTALDTATGKTLWETDRPPMVAPSGDQKKSYCTPILITDAEGREQLICMGSQWMVSYDASSGDERWRLRHGTGFSVVPRPVYSPETGLLIFATGFGKPELWAVRVDGSGDVTDTHVEWTVAKGIPAKPSPLLHNGLVYVVDDNGVASCYELSDGTMVWKERLGGKFSASPLLAGEHLYFGNHEGEIFVLSLGRESEVIATNQIGGQIMASPAAVDDALVIRTDTSLMRFDRLP